MIIKWEEFPVLIDLICLITSTDFNRLSIDLKLVIINFRISADFFKLIITQYFLLYSLLVHVVPPSICAYHQIFWNSALPILKHLQTLSGIQLLLLILSRNKGLFIIVPFNVTHFQSYYNREMYHANCWHADLPAVTTVIEEQLCLWMTLSFSATLWLVNVWGRSWHLSKS